MSLISRVEEIIKRIEPSLGARYIGARGANAEGQQYIKAAYFIFELPNQKRVEVGISGDDEMQQDTDQKLEKLLRDKLERAIKSSTP